MVNKKGYGVVYTADGTEPGRVARDDSHRMLERFCVIDVVVLRGEEPKIYARAKSPTSNKLTIEKEFGMLPASLRLLEYGDLVVLNRSG